MAAAAVLLSGPLVLVCVLSVLPLSPPPPLQGMDLYVSAMQAQGAMPLRNGVSVRFRHVYINLGHIDWNNATASATAQAPTIIAMMTRVATPAYAAALGGPFPLIIAPLLTPAVMLGTCETQTNKTNQNNDNKQKKTSTHCSDAPAPAPAAAVAHWVARGGKREWGKGGVSCRCAG